MAFRSPAFASFVSRVLALVGFIGFLSSIRCWIHSAQTCRNSGVSSSSGNSVCSCALMIKIGVVFLESLPPWGLGGSLGLGLGIGSGIGSGVGIGIGKKGPRLVPFENPFGSE